MLNGIALYMFYFVRYEWIFIINIARYKFDDSTGKRQSTEHVNLIHGLFNNNVKENFQEEKNVS